MPLVPDSGLLDVDVDGLVGHGSDDVIVGSRHARVGARVGLSGPDRVEGALVERCGADSIHDDVIAQA